MVAELPISLHSEPEPTPQAKPLALWDAQPIGEGLVLEAIQIGPFFVHQIVSPFFKENAFLVEHPSSQSAIAIDPGFGSEPPISRLLARSGTQLTHILLTHEHIDHIGNLNELRAVHPCPVVASALCSQHIVHEKHNLSAFHFGHAYRAEPADLLMAINGTCLLWSETILNLHSMPGHTHSGMSIHLPGMLFTGDTMIYNEKSVIKLPGGDRAELEQSLASVFSSHSPDTLVWGGHGRAFYLAETKAEIHLPPRSSRLALHTTVCETCPPD